MNYEASNDPKSIEAMLDRLRQLEVLVSAFEIDTHCNPILDRREISTRLGLSERTLRDNQAFRLIELRIGKKVFYDWRDVMKIIKSINLKKEYLNV